MLAFLVGLLYILLRYVPPSVILLLHLLFLSYNTGLECILKKKMAWNGMKDAMTLYAGRVLLGYCTGILSYVVSIYSSQYAPKLLFF